MIIRNKSKIAANLKSLFSIVIKLGLKANFKKDTNPVHLRLQRTEPYDL